MIVKSASASWEGSLKEGRGTVSTESGALDSQPFGFATRFEDKPGTNPEELIGAAHSACFSMALSNVLGEEGVTAERIATQAHVTLAKTEAGFTVTKVHLAVTITADAPESLLLAAAKKAKEGCPISRLLKAEISLEAQIG